MSSETPSKSGLGMMWWSARHPPKDPKNSFNGKVILLTGANIGLGFEAALKYATLGASRLILGVRSLERGEAAKADICRRSGFDASNIQLYELDMSSLAAVAKFATAIKENEPSLNIAVLNAGVASSSYHLSPDGYEMTIQVNVLSTSLLAILITPLLRHSSILSGTDSHIILVGSVAHHSVKSELFGDINDEKKLLDRVNRRDFFNIERQYSVSKLLLMYAMTGLVKWVDSSNDRESSSVIITTVCPGLCRTNLGRDFSIFLQAPNALFQLLFARSAEEGSRTIVSGSVLGNEAHEQFWSHDTLYKKGDLVISAIGKILQKKFWNEISQVLSQHSNQTFS